MDAQFLKKNPWVLPVSSFKFLHWFNWERKSLKQDNVKWEFFLYSPWALCHSVFQHLHRGDYSPPPRFFHLYSCPTLDISGLTVVSRSCSTFSLVFVAPRESCEENVETWKHCNKKFHKSSLDSKTYPLILVRSLMSLVSLWVYRLTTFLVSVSTSSSRAC